MPDNNERDIKKNTNEQYECLGRFVEAFEDMVDWMRIASMDLLSHLSDNPTQSETHRILLHIVFYHQALSAKPLLELMRAMVAEVLNSSEYRTRYGVTDAERAAVLGALKTISDECTDLIATRNNLLHATWYMGSLDQDDPASDDFFVWKGSSNKDGWAPLELPRKVAELRELSRRCINVIHWIDVLTRCLPMSSSRLKIQDCFKKDGKRWECVLPMDTSY
jgi:hypothetical protein